MRGTFASAGPATPLPRHLGRAALLLIAALAAASTHGWAQARLRGVSVVSDHGYPELRVDGAPFFLRAASFDYARIPRDRWARTLDQYQALGINTVDLPVRWNWHEIQSGEFDFNGRTNSRRDLNGLLRMVAARNLHLIARVGPETGSFWRNSGVPGWITANGRKQAEQKWLEAVARELAPYQAGQSPPIEPLSGAVGPTRQQASAPLLFVIVGNEAAASDVDERSETGVDSDSDRNEMAQWREALHAGGLRSPLVLKAREIARAEWAAAGTVPRSARDRLTNGENIARTALPETGIGGQWFFEPPKRLEDVPLGGAQLDAKDVATLELLSGLLGTQPEVPPLVTALAASAPAPAEDSQAVASAPDNLLLASRLLLGGGVRGIEYAPLEDTLTPAGWSAPGVNRFFRWNAALGLDGQRQEQLGSVQRNAWLLNAWGTQLASSHVGADFALVVPQIAASRPGALRSAAQIERIAEMAGLVPDFVNPGPQPAQRLLDDPVILLPVPAPGGTTVPLSQSAQEALVEYVRRGGTLICFPRRPAGKLFGPFWKTAETKWTGPQGLQAERRVLGRGSLVVWAEDFYSWVDPSRSFADTRGQFDAKWAIESLRQLVAISGKRPVIGREGVNPGPAPGRLILSELVPDDIAAVATGRTSACAGEHLCAAALVSATNLDWNQPAKERLEIRSPILSRDIRGNDSTDLDLTVPPHDSLLLPVHAPLCATRLAATTCPDEVVIAGAELLAAERKDKTLGLVFYTPERASVVLRLRQRPGKIEAGNYRLTGSWDGKTHLLRLSLPAGASPNFLRVLTIHLNYTPDVRERGKPPKEKRPQYSFTIPSAVKLPLGNDASLASWPGLIVVDREVEGRMVIDVSNLGRDAHTFTARVEGTVQGSDSTKVRGGQSAFLPVKLHLDVKSGESGASPTSDNELLHGELQVQVNQERKKEPLEFVVVGNQPGAQPAHFQFDFDRDGNDEWVLENPRLRLILSPAEGGQAVALVDLTSQLNALSSVGALFDSVSGPRAGSNEMRVEDALARRPYSAKWITIGGQPAVQMRYSDFRPGGDQIAIEKTVRLSGEYGVDVTYRVVTSSAAAPGGPAGVRDRLTIGSSVPAETNRQRTTQFCWKLAGSEESSAPTQGGKNGEARQQCIPFAPGGAPIRLPSTVRRIEVHTEGFPGLAVTWNRGSMTVVPMNYSAELKLRVATNQDGTPAKATLRYTLLPTD